jgi:hydrogenase expression/formation protein HypC
MCLAIPGKLVEIIMDDSLAMGKIDFGGTITLACLEYVPEIEIGQYTLVHAGFAIAILNETEARNSLKTWDELRRTMAENQ